MDTRKLPEIAIGLTALTALGALTWSLAKRSEARLPLPPGPKSLPLIGNLLDMPGEKDWLVYREWAKTYGDVVHVQTLGQHVIILDSAKAVKDLLERRSTIYSGRPSTVMLMQLMGLAEWNISVQTYGDPWRSRRRIFHSELHVTAVPKYQGVQFRQARLFLKQLAADTSDLSASVRGTVGATIMDIVYGIQVAEKNDRYIPAAEDFVERISAASLPGAFLVDAFPALRHIPRWFPGAEFLKLASQFRTLSEEVMEEPMREVERTMASGTARPSFTSELLDKIKGDTASDERRKIKEVAAVAYSAGADTTVSTLMSFFLAMAIYPEVQAKAQAELDAVVGPDRLPEFADRDELPYVNAIISELFRWQPVVPLGNPHATTADDEYNGYFIPKGTVVMGNIWSILHNPEDYPDPEEFYPERFLHTTADGRYAPNKDVRDPRGAFFGFGRRICPGSHLAEQSTFIVVASVLSAFSIAPPLDAQGKSIQLKVEMSSGMISHPAPFKCTIKPRSQRAAELIGQPLPEREL